MTTGVGRFCVRDVITITRETTIVQAAQLMRTHHIGALVVVEQDDHGKTPLGMLTDRDIVVEVIAAGLAPETLRVGDLLLRAPTTLPENAGYAEAARAMSISGVRRLPLVDAQGRLAGIITMDDMLRQLAGPIAALSDLAARERHFEHETRP